MKIITMGLLACVMSGCVTFKPVSLPNGTQGFAIDCSGGEHDISDCMNKAAEVCHGPYQMLNQDGSTAAVGVVPVGTGALFVPMQRRVLIVGCQ